MRYTKNANHSYMILEGQQNDYQMKMLLVNEIQGLLPVTVQHTDGRIDFCYEISGKTSFSKCYREKQIDAKQIRLFFLQLQHVISNMQSFLLDENRLILTPEQIYVQEKEEQIYFVFAPCQYGEQNFQKALRECVEFMIKRVEHEDELSIKMAYQIFHVVIQEYFRLEDILNTINCVRMEEKQSREYGISQEENELEKLSEQPQNVGFLDGKQRGDIFQRYFGKRQKNGYIGKDDIDTKNMRQDMSDLGSKRENAVWKYVLIAGMGLFGVMLLILWKNGGWGYFNQENRLIGIGMICAVVCFCVGIFVLAWRGKKMGEGEKLSDCTNDEKWEWNEKSNDIRQRQKNNEAFQPYAQNRNEKSVNQKEEKGFIEEMDCEELSQSRNQKENAYQETTMLGIYGGKLHQLLSHEPMRYPSISLEVYPFLVGKESGSCQAILSMNTISRVHARLEQKGEQILLYDCNSKNGTWVNGERINSQIGVELKAGDEIKFADTVFTFL